MESLTRNRKNELLRHPPFRIFLLISVTKVMQHRARLATKRAHSFYVPLSTLCRACNALCFASMLLSRPRECLFSHQVWTHRAFVTPRYFSNTIPRDKVQLESVTDQGRTVVKVFSPGSRFETILLDSARRCRPTTKHIQVLACTTRFVRRTGAHSEWNEAGGLKQAGQTVLPQLQQHARLL